MTVDLIVNPASGPVVGRLPRRERVHAVSHLLRTLGATTIRATETTGPGDAAEAVRAALDAGSDRVVVWGGDGTLNEVAGSLLDTGMRLGVVPGGSGNGFARGLGLPPRPASGRCTWRCSDGRATSTPGWSTAARS